MKARINHTAAESFEFAKRTLYSFEVLIIGVLIPVLFMVGITTDTHNKTWENDASLSSPRYNAPRQGLVDFSQVLCDQNS